MDPGKTTGNDRKKRLLKTTSADSPTTYGAGDESPQQYIQSPFGSKIVPVAKPGSRRTGQNVDVFKRPHAVVRETAGVPKKQRKVLSEDKFTEVSKFRIY